MSRINFNKIIEDRRKSVTADMPILGGMQRRDSAFVIPKLSSTEDLRKYGFEVGPILGEGTYSKVREASYKGVKIAVKIITMSKLSKEFANKFLPRELELLSKVKHENIIKVYKIFNFSKRVYIFMELIDGGDMLHYVRNNGRLSEDEARNYFGQMVSAMRYLHKLNIAHRDLKCENVMIDLKGIIRIIDFGFCRSVLDGNGRRTLSETFCGSTAYAAPEVLQGKPYNPMLYDVWSLGCILFIMATGRMPFDDSNVRKMLICQKQRQIKFPTSFLLNNTLKDLIRSMLEPDITKRATLERVNNSMWMGVRSESVQRSSHPFFPAFRVSDEDHRSSEGDDNA